MSPCSAAWTKLCRIRGFQRANADRPEAHMNLGAFYDFHPPSSISSASEVPLCTCHEA